MVETPLTEAAADADGDDDYSDDPRFDFDDVELGRPDPDVTALRMRGLPVDPPADTDLNVDWTGA